MTTEYGDSIVAECPRCAWIGPARLTLARARADGAAHAQECRPPEPDVLDDVELDGDAVYALYVLERDGCVDLEDGTLMGIVVADLAEQGMAVMFGDEVELTELGRAVIARLEEKGAAR